MILRHVALVCRSEENADRFYKDLLGLKKQEPKTIPASLSAAIFHIESEFTLINYIGDRCHFEIFLSDRAPGDTRPIDHTCLDVGDLSAFIEKCRDLEVTVIQAPKGEKILTFVTDYDGNLFEIVGQ